MRQLRYHRSTDPSKLKRPWVLFNKLTFLVPFVAHVVDKNSFENYSEATNGSATEKASLHDYLSKYQTENYYECDGTEIHDLTMDAAADATGEEEDIIQQNHQPHGSSSNSKKRKLNLTVGSDSLVSDRKPYEMVQRVDNFYDEHDHFLLSLAPEIKKIDSKYNLHFRNEVHNLIMKYQSMSSNEE